MVDDQFHGDERVDPGRIAAEDAQRVAHGGEVDHAGHAGEILHEDSLRGEGDLGRVGPAEAVSLRVPAPVGHCLDVAGMDGQTVLVAEQVLQEDLDRVGEPADGKTVGQRVDAVDLVAPVAHGEVGSGAEAVGTGGSGGGLCHGPILLAPTAIGYLTGRRLELAGRRPEPGGAPAPA